MQYAFYKISRGCILGLFRFLWKQLVRITHNREVVLIEIHISVKKLNSYKQLKKPKGLSN